jgi:hypothetical protein
MGQVASNTNISPPSPSTLLLHQSFKKKNIMAYQKILSDGAVCVQESCRAGVKDGLHEHVTPVMSLLTVMNNGGRGIAQRLKWIW